MNMDESADFSANMLQSYVKGENSLQTTAFTLTFSFATGLVMWAAGRCDKGEDTIQIFRTWPEDTGTGFGLIVGGAAITWLYVHLFRSAEKRRQEAAEALVEMK